MRDGDWKQISENTVSIWVPSANSSQLHVSENDALVAAGSSVTRRASSTLRDGADTVPSIMSDG